MSQGVTGVDYSMQFFVGLANFKGTSTSVLGVQNVQQYVEVTKTNELTVSTFGTNQDPLLTSQSMSLVRIKVTDYFQNVSYLYYLQATFTMPSNYQSPKSGGSIVPLDGVRVIKTAGGRTVSASDPEWKQACAASGNASYVFKDPALQDLVDRAQSQDCVQNYLQMCAPPAKASGVVSFGIPLPIGFLTDDDFAGAATGNPTSLQAQFVVQASNALTKATVLNTVSMSVRLSPIGLSMVCESRSASQNLADIINGSIFVGLAETDSEWASTIQAQTAIQVPGSTPAKSLQFNTETVQSSIMTFSALGDYGYFRDARYAKQSVHMNDIWTVNFLEPMDGTMTGATPNFDAVKKLFFDGLAFEEVVDPVTHALWLKPSTALLRRCPQRPTQGKLACLTKSISTYANNTLTRSANDVVEVLVGSQGPASMAQMENLMGRVFMNGGSTARTRQYGDNFYTELVGKLGLTDNRFRKAYVVSPMVDWTMAAIEASEPGKTVYTLASKIIAIGLITIQSESGQQLARRLLSIGLGNDDAAHPLPIASPAALEYDDEEYDMDPTRIQYVLQGPQRRMLQAASGTSLAPSMTNTGNALLMDLKVPGYEPTTQMCSMINADLSTCRMMQFTIQVAPHRAASVCDAYALGTLQTILSDGFRSTMVVPASNITNTLLTNLEVNGCVDPSLAGRRLLQYTNLVIVVTNVLIDVVDGVARFDKLWLQYITDLENATVIQTLLGGQASVVAPSMPVIPPSLLHNGTAASGATFYANLTINIYNASNRTVWNSTLFPTLFHPPPDGSAGSLAFSTDTNVRLLTLNAAAAKDAAQSSSATRTALLVPWLNALVLVALASTCLY